MFDEWLTSQIMGIIVGATGCYLIGDFWLAVGVLMVVWGNNIQLAVKKPWKIKVEKHSSFVGD